MSNLALSSSQVYQCQIPTSITPENLVIRDSEGFSLSVRHCNRDRTLVVSAQIKKLLDISNLLFWATPRCSELPSLNQMIIRFRLYYRITPQKLLYNYCWYLQLLSELGCFTGHCQEYCCAMVVHRSAQIVQHFLPAMNYHLLVRS